MQETYYEEVKDSCDFVQISQFGFCIGKTFMQLMKIIKWVLKEWIKENKPADKMTKFLQKTNDNIDQTERLESNNICSFCQQIIKTTPAGKQFKSKRKGIAVSNNNNEVRQAKKIHINETNHLMNHKDKVIEKFTLKQIESKKCIFDNEQLDILNRKQETLKLEISNGENVLQEILNEFNVKNQSIARFVINSQANFMEDVKVNQNTDFTQFEEAMKEIIKSKFNEASQKIKQITKYRLAEQQRQRKKRQFCKEVQTMAQQINETDKSQFKLKKLNIDMQRLKNELSAQKDLNQSLKQLLQSKSIEFQEEFLSYRKDLIIENKEKLYLKSLRSFNETINQVEQGREENRVSIHEESMSKNLMPNNSKVSNIYSKDKNKENNRKKFRNEIKFTFECEEGSSYNGDYGSKTGLINGWLGQPDDKKTNSNTWNEGENWKEKHSKEDMQVQVIKYQSQVSEQLKQACHVSIQTDPVKIQSWEIDQLTNLQRKSIIPKSPQNKSQKKYTNIYSNVKSRVYNIPVRLMHPPKENIEPKAQSSQHLLIKKLIEEQSGGLLSYERVQCFKMRLQPIFSSVKRILLTKQDIIGLYINEMNAKNYQCMLYRNQMFNLSNINQKRVINLSNKTETHPNDTPSSTPNHTLHAKLCNSFYHQLKYLRKRQKLIYFILKSILRSPYEIMKKLEYTQLQPQSDNQLQEVIEYGQLKKMINLILKLHLGCVGNEKDVICKHVAYFCEKVGIKLYE